MFDKMKEVKLSQGFVAIVDDCDYERVSKHPWHVYKSRARVPIYYAERSYRVNGITRTISMHLFILGKRDGFVIDHADRNGLNNTRANLRFVTFSQNRLNTKCRLNRDNKYKGVFLDKRDGVYYSQIMVERKRVCIGRNKSDYECALMHDRAAIRYHGELANLNFPDLIDMYKEEIKFLT